MLYHLKQSLAAAALSAAHLRVLIAASILIRESPLIGFSSPVIIQALKVLLQQAAALSLRPCSRATEPLYQNTAGVGHLILCKRLLLAWAFLHHSMKSTGHSSPCCFEVVKTSCFGCSIQLQPDAMLS